VLLDGLKGRRFHVAECITLAEMRAKNRFDRYVVTNNFSGEFQVHGLDSVSRSPVEGVAELRVCKNCLKALNYQDYLLQNRREQNEIHRKFSIDRFFERYSTFFKHLPSRDVAALRSGYTADWPQVSERIRKEAGYVCEECGIDLHEHKRLLHVHHGNGVKADNRRENLRALCCDCHRKQPMHEMMLVSARDMAVINALRKNARGTTSPDWTNVFVEADLGLHDVLHVLQSEGMPTPEVSLPLRTDDTRAAVALGWSRKRVGICIDSASEARARKAGWKVFNVVSAIEKVSEIRRLISK